MCRKCDMIAEQKEIAQEGNPGQRLMAALGNEVGLSIPEILDVLRSRQSRAKSWVGLMRLERLERDYMDAVSHYENSR